MFAHPQILWLLLVFPPAMVAFFWWSSRRRQELTARFIQARLLPGLVAGISPVRRRLRLVCLVLAVVALLVALARPQWGFSWQEVKQRGVDIVVAIDTSKSMLAEDIPPNRLARAKLAALDLMALARSDRLGLVAFAGNAFLQCPLTIDDAAFRQSVESLNVNTLPVGGTALAAAIETAQTAFKEGDNHKVLVLLTDGEDQDSGAVQVAQKAAESGLRIYAIGVGTTDGDLLRVKTAQGSDYIRDEKGQVVKSHLNERLLTEIATAAQGFYLPLRGATAMQTLYTQGLATLPKSEHQEKLVKQYRDRYHWPLAVAILLLIVEILLPERKREPGVVPASGQAASFSAIKAAAALLLVLAMVMPGTVSASPSSALREYNAGKYDDALKEYERLLKKNADDPRLHFNAGTAAYRNRQYDEAAREFQKALGAVDLKLQAPAYYNHGNAMFRLGEQVQDPNKRTEAWQQALQDYDLSKKLNPQDPDSNFNYDFVKKKLEELKQQQQQQQQSKQDKSDQQNQDQQQSQSQPQQDQSREQKQPQNAQQKQQQQQEQQQQQQQQQQAQQQQNQQQQQAQQQQQQGGQPKDEKQQQQQAQAAEKGGDKENAQAAAGQMTPEQAQQLLDSQKGEEKMLSPKQEGKPYEPQRPLHDW